MAARARPGSTSDGAAAQSGLPRGPLVLVLLGVLAAAAVFALIEERREAPERQPLALHDNLMEAFRDGEWVRPTRRINLGSPVGQRHTVEVVRHEFSRAEGTLSRPEGKPPFAWMAGDAPSITLDVLEPAERELTLSVAKGVSADVQQLVLEFNGHPLPAARLPKNGRFGFVTQTVPAEWQQRGTNVLAFRFDSLEVRRLADQPGDLPLAGLVSTVDFLAEGEQPLPPPARAGVLEVDGPGAPHVSVVIPAETSARAATLVPRASRAILRVVVERLDVPLDLSVQLDSGQRVRLGALQPGATLPLEARYDLTPFAGRAATIDAWARGRAEDGGEVRLSRVGVLVPDAEQQRLLSERGALGRFAPVGTLSYGAGADEASDAGAADDASSTDAPFTRAPAARARPGGGPARPSFLVVVLDALARRFVGAFGGPSGATPALDRLAREGLVASDAVAPASYTLASVGTLLTGTEPVEHGVVLVSDGDAILTLDEHAPSLASTFAAAGWRTRAFVTNPNAAARHGYARGFERYDELFADPELWDEGVSGAELPPRLAAFLAETGDAPFLAYVHVFEPHAPYRAPDALRARFVTTPYDGPVSGERAWIDAYRTSDVAVSDLGWTHLAELYTARVALADSVLADLLATLVDAGRADDTVVLVVSDHGEGLGQHDTLEHGDLVTHEQVDVPFVLRADWLAAGTIDGPVTLSDVAPTLLGLAGLDVPSAMSGVDLLGERLDPRRPRLSRNAALRPQFGWTRSGLRLVVDLETRAVALYDILRDPDELHDVSLERPASTALLLRELVAALTVRGGARAVEPSEDLSVDIGAIGYVMNPGRAVDESASVDFAQELRHLRRRL